MGEAVLSAILPVLLEKLADLEVLVYLGRITWVDKKMLQKLTQTLTAIEAVLSDAEEKQLTQSGVKEWLDDLRDLVYDVQDILDIFDTKMLERMIRRQQGQQGGKIKLWSSRISEAKFSFRLNSTIKKISDRLDDLTARKKQFGLKNLGVSKKPWKMPLTTCQLDGHVIGRDDANATILDKLLSEQEHCTSTSQNYHVVAIVGTGGLGKTTLAKHIFNNAKTDQFSVKGWVCVSDDFDIVRVTLAVLESVASAPVHDMKELNTIQEKLSKELAGKKFLIVLDDVWDTCSYSQWAILQSSFCFGAAGSKIIVTTRDSYVAKMTGDNNPYRLELMSADDCWKIFEHYVLLNNRPQDVEFLKEKIVAKCNGLPLCASTLGGLLRCKEVDEWGEILDHKMWNQVGILPALKLSYHYLPSNLKQCFSYCAILPYDYEFEEKQLILWWMAEGLILQQPGENIQMEDLGRDYFQELVSRSLFQISPKDKLRYIMHDLVTDLARWAAGSSCSRLEEMKNSDSHSRCLVRHSSYIPGEYDRVEKFGFYAEAARLRTFLPLSLTVPNPNNYKYLALEVTSELLPKLQYLRLLTLSGYRITELPVEIGNLKHLRYLDLSHTEIRSLPDSTTTLYNLQTLLLNGCSKLKALPTGMKNLVNLRHLNNSGTYSLEEMPPQLGELTNLKTLPSFVIGKYGGSGLGEIGSLLHLQGTLRLSRLENVICVKDARSANLKRKERLEALQLEWSSSVLAELEALQLEWSSSVLAEPEVVLGMLQPHSNLKELTIEGYGGLKFPTWIGDPSFSNMVCIVLEGCSHCLFLPPLGQLPALRELFIKRMDALESVGLEFYGNCKLLFQALETLEFKDLKNWKGWSPCQQNEGVGAFSCLKILTIRDCPKLEGNLPEKLDSLTQLEICGCQELVVSVSNYNQLQESKIENCKMVKDVAEGEKAAKRLARSQSANPDDYEEASKCIKLSYDLKDLDCKTEIELLESIVDFECSKIYSVDFEVFEATKQAMDEVMKGLKDEKATVIGVYGAGGVGKTAMVKHVCAKVPNTGMFHHVITAVVSKSPDLRKIQGTLADMLGLELVEETEIGRSRRLMQKIRRESRILIILDDMWERIDLCNIGLPSYHELQRCNSKVLLITRAHNVLHAMGCQSNIHLDVLSEEDSRKLFMNSARLTPVELTKFYDVANSVARECAGLPIALIAVAKALRGKDKWMEAGSRLCVSEPANPEYEKVVFNCLKLSYDYLASDDARSCFLLCCLFPEDYDIQIEDLLMYAMGKGLFQDSRTMQDARASAHSVVKYLRHCSLLLESERDGCVKMHDVVRDVAIRISSSENRQLFFVQAGCQLKEWPDMGAHESCSGMIKQKEEYSAISLIRNKICKLPEKLVCPKLLILFLQSNVCLDEIPENFFQSLIVLRVLDLSQTRISILPTSLALLINLHTLYLDGCLSIINLSLLGKLEKLEILSMRELPLLELPKEIGHLSNLRKLDITGEYVDIVPSEVISNLHRLEELYMQCNFADWKSEVGKTKVNGSKVDEAGKENVAAFAELTSLSRLNILKVFISEANSLPKVVGVEPKWINFNICVSGSLSIREVSLEVSKKRREVSLVSNSSPIHTRALTLGTTIKDLPGWFVNVVTTKAEKLQYLMCKELDNIVVEYDHGRLHALKYLRVIGPSEKLEVLMNTSARIEPVFQDLEELHLIQVDCLKKLCFGELPPESLCNLRLLKVKHCYELVGALLPSQLLQRLQNLEKLICEEMDELEYVFGSEGLSAEQIDMTELKNIRLKNLANLIKIWNGPVSCNIFQHLQSLVVSGCLELRNLFAADVAHFLLQLENLSIECCPILDSVIEASKETMDTNIIFPNLKILVLIKLPRLTRFYSNSEIAIECPLLEYLNVERCPQFSTDVQLNYQQHLNIVQRSSTIINQREV